MGGSVFQKVLWVALYSKKVLSFMGDPVFQKSPILRGSLYIPKKSYPSWLALYSKKVLSYVGDPVFQKNHK